MVSGQIGREKNQVCTLPFTPGGRLYVMLSARQKVRRLPWEAPTVTGIAPMSSAIAEKWRASILSEGGGTMENLGGKKSSSQVRKESTYLKTG